MVEKIVLGAIATVTFIVAVWVKAVDSSQKKELKNENENLKKDNEELKRQNDEYQMEKNEQEIKKEQVKIQKKKIEEFDFSDLDDDDIGEGSE